jgi:hypothetical protein
MFSLVLPPPFQTVSYFLLFYMHNFYYVSKHDVYLNLQFKMECIILWMQQNQHGLFLPLYIFPPLEG